MAKHQIVLVGGQLFPILIGIKELSPDFIHFIVSNESKDKINLLKPLIVSTLCTESICNPYDFFSIKKTCEDIIDTIKEKEEVLFNVTGGTKIMMIASQSVMQRHNLKGFYINQNDTLIRLPSLEMLPLISECTAKEFFGLSGHFINNFKNLNDYSSNDIETVEKIAWFADTQSKIYLQINSCIRNSFEKISKIPTTGKLNINPSINISWSQSSLEIESNGVNILKLTSNNIRYIFFHCGWWELYVAKEIFKWPRIKELLLQCELPFKADNQTMKNEIDVLLNLGRKMIFIECKSGIVNQHDINKMRVIKQTYGGEISKSILVSRFCPNSNIIEKCNELDIEVFFQYKNLKKVNSISKLIESLEIVSRKFEL